MKKTFHSSTDDQEETENAKQTTVVAISVGRLSHRKLDPEPYPLLLHRQCSWGMCSVVMCLSNFSPGGI